MDFSYLSANCPNRAENRKNGRMKTMALKFTSWSVFSPTILLLSNTSRAASAFLNTLSLNAPNPWVMKNGMNLRWENRENCELPDISGHAGQHAGDGGCHHRCERSPEHCAQSQASKV